MLNDNTKWCIKKFSLSAYSWHFFEASAYFYAPSSLCVGMASRCQSEFQGVRSAVQLWPVHVWSDGRQVENLRNHGLSGQIEGSHQLHSLLDVLCMYVEKCTSEVVASCALTHSGLKPLPLPCLWTTFTSVCSVSLFASKFTVVLLNVPN